MKTNDSSEPKTKIFLFILNTNILRLTNVINTDLKFGVTSKTPGFLF